MRDFIGVCCVDIFLLFYVCGICYCCDIQAEYNLLLQLLFWCADMLQVYFEVSVAPLGTVVYHVKSVEANASNCHLAELHVYSAQHSHSLRLLMLFSLT